MIVGHKVNIMMQSSWKILVGLASGMGQKLKYNMAEEVFYDISNSIDILKVYIMI